MAFLFADCNLFKVSYEVTNETTFSNSVISFIGQRYLTTVINGAQTATINRC